MAKFVVFRAAQIGDGSRFDLWRAAILDHLNGCQRTVECRYHRARNVFYGLAWVWDDADAGRFDLAAADPNVTLLSPVVDSRADIRAWMGGPVDAPLLAVLEADGIDASDAVVGVTTRRQVFRGAFRHLSLGQVASRKTGGTADLVRLMAAAPDARVTTVLTAQQRTAARAWMTERGLTVPAWTAATTCRQVVRFVLDSMAVPELEQVE